MNVLGEEQNMPAVVWKGYITFGLVSFPVRLFSAARPEAVHFHMLHRTDLSRVKEVWYCAEEDKPIERADIVKGYEISKGKYVVVDDEELKKIAPATAETMEIVQFVHDADVDPIYFERSYYMAPGDEVSKPYVLFMKALSETSYSAIAKVTMHGREHVVIIRSAQGQLLLHTLYYADELHEANKPSVPAKANATRKELELATQLIEHLAAPFKPGEYHDTYRENVEKLIEQKKKGQKVTAEPKPRRAPVVDLMEALKKSLKSSEAKAKANKTPRRRKVA
jgi:DNA end-binding protein Ku